MSAHTPGALRAAKEIVEATQELMPDTILRAASMIDKTAALIDRETAAPELLAELENIANAKPEKWGYDMQDQFQSWAQNRARAAIAKVNGKT